ncbi:MAG: Flp pilus assembly protein CpaB [Chloroflexota bacterium]
MSVRRYIIIAILSGIGACIVAGLLLFQLSRSSVRKAEEAGVTIKIIVASRDLTVGTRLSEDMLAEARFLEQSAPDGYFVDVVDLVGMTLNTAIYKGQAITEKQVGSGNELRPSSQVSSGYVAYALAIDPDLGVGGVIEPGDRIDILSTTEEETKVLLSDVVVIGIAGEFPFGPAPTPTSELGSTGDSLGLTRSLPMGTPTEKIFILELTLEQARLLADARANAIVSIALHSSK